jgi:beta-glucosidase
MNSGSPPSQEITNHFQHDAVDHTRLHIPLLFGADVIHGFHTIFPVPLATAASRDPELISSLAHMAAVEAKTAGVNTPGSDSSSA